jgi:hypothetical protein
LAESQAPGTAHAVEITPASTSDASHVSGVDGTLMMAHPPTPPAAPAHDSHGRHASPAAEAPNGVVGLGQTALSEDYLRAAREAALAQLASRPGVTGSAGDTSSTLASPGASAPAPAPEPSVGSADPMPRLAPQHDAVVDAALEPHEAAPGAHTFPSLVPPPLVNSAPATPERRPPVSSRGFEPVPVVRAPLAESLSGALSPIMDVGAHRQPPPPFRPRPPAPAREGAGRWLLLASVALATVGVVTLGSRLLDRYRSSPARVQAGATAERAPRTDATPPAPTGSASRALMANRPAPERAADGRPRVVWATGAPGAASNETESAEAASASPESQLAATAGRHVLSGNYAEALPLYRQLERRWPENTGYGAMARLLEKRLGTANDTRTITPTEPASGRPR